jgi:membrane protease subunit (stomatin/prohibitin family)
VKEILAKIDKQYKIQEKYISEYSQGVKMGLRLARDYILSEQKEPCEWTQEDDDLNTWHCNKCDAVWTLEAGTPQDNSMRFCPECGRPLNQPSTDAS